MKNNKYTYIDTAYEIHSRFTLLTCISTLVANISALIFVAIGVLEQYTELAFFDTLMTFVEAYGVYMIAIPMAIGVLGILATLGAFANLVFTYKRVATEINCTTPMSMALKPILFRRRISLGVVASAVACLTLAYQLYYLSVIGDVVFAIMTAVAMTVGIFAFFKFAKTLDLLTEAGNYVIYSTEKATRKAN